MKAQIPDFATPSGIYLALIKVLAQRKETTKAMEVPILPFHADR